MATSGPDWVMQQVIAWQSRARHKITCGHSELHPPLEPRQEGGTVILVCTGRNCSYQMRYVPLDVLNAESLPAAAPVGPLLP